MKVQLWICALFLADFVLEWFLAEKKGHYVATHFIFPAGSYTLSKHHCLYGMDFLTRDNLYAAFHPISAGWLRHGYRGGLADVQPRIGTVRFLPYHVAGHCLFFQSGLFMSWSMVPIL